MATSAVPGSKVRTLASEGGLLPEGIAVDHTGQTVTDPNALSRGGGGLVPFGGAKGYCLALLVEILSGVLTGAGISSGVKSMYADLEPGENGHFFIALDVTKFMSLDDYYERLESLIGTIQASGGGTGDDVSLPGDARWRAYNENTANGVPIDGNTRAALERLAAQRGLAVPW